MTTFLVNQAAQHGQKIDPNSKEHMDIVDKIFESEDKDHDGVISHNEFSGPKHDEL